MTVITFFVRKSCNLFTNSTYKRNSHKRNSHKEIIVFFRDTVFMLKNHLISRFSALIAIGVISTISCSIQQSAQAQTDINKVKFNRCRAASQLTHFRDLGYSVSSNRINERGYVIAPPRSNTYSKRVWEEERCWEVRDIYTWFLAPPNDDYEMCLVAAQLGLIQKRIPRGTSIEVLEPPSRSKRRVMDNWRNLNCNVIVQQYYHN